MWWAREDARGSRQSWSSCLTRQFAQETVDLWGQISLQLDYSTDSPYYPGRFVNNIYKNQIYDIIALKNTAKIAYLFSHDADIVLNCLENQS